MLDLIKHILFSCILFLSYCSYAQSYSKEKNCDTDTIHVQYRDLKTGEEVSYLAFECTQVKKLGFRLNIGVSNFLYNTQVKQWLGNHRAFEIGADLVYHRINLGVKVKLATISPGTILIFDGDTLTKTDTLNPIKVDYFASYSFNFGKNFSIEPTLGITHHQFYVINEKELNRSYNIKDIVGLNAGFTLNKYFSLKGFKFLAIYLHYGYSLSNFKKVHSSLGRGYSEWSAGVSYKLYAKRRFNEKIN